MFKICDATLDDLPEMMEHAKVFVEFYGMEWHEPSVNALLIKLINNGVVKVALADGKVVGGIGGIVVPNPWNTQHKLMQELFWWVAEEFRGTSVGLRLLHAFENSFEGTKVLSVLPQTPIKKDMLTKLGYSIKEYSFVKE
jgi:RimJ/RimL family protein N-acetyltransferase